MDFVIFSNDIKLHFYALNSLQDQPIPYSNETEEDEFDDLPPLLNRDEV